MENEIWKDVAGYEGCYQVSNLGRIKSLSRLVDGKRGGLPYYRPEMILRNKKKPNGYLFVSLCKDGKIKYSHVHRLVALAFITNPEGKNDVNHKDAVKSNNQLDNLEWMTRLENNRHARANGLVSLPRAHKGSKNYNARKINQLDLSGNLVKQWGSIAEAAQYHKCSHAGISRVLRKAYGTPTCKGYKWDYSSNNPLTA